MNRGEEGFTVPGPMTPVKTNECLICHRIFTPPAKAPDEAFCSQCLQGKDKPREYRTKSWKRRHRRRPESTETALASTRRDDNDVAKAKILPGNKRP